MLHLIPYPKVETFTQKTTSSTQYHYTRLFTDHTNIRVAQASSSPQTLFLFTSSNLFDHLKPKTAHRRELNQPLKRSTVG
jgi:hypothetical protein